MPLSELAGLTLQVGDQKGGTESLLRAAGALDGLPYKVAFSTFTSGPPQIEAATAGKIDFAITGNTPPIFGAASNAKVKVVSAYDGGGVGDQVLVHADSPIRPSPICGVSASRSARAARRTATCSRQLNKRRADAGGRHAGVSAARRRAVARSRSGRSTRGRSGIRTPRRPKPTFRSAASPRRQDVTNGCWFGIASDQALADPKRNTALSDLLVRFEKAARWAKDNPEQWAQSYAAAVGLDPKVADVVAGAQPAAAHRA